MDGASAKKSTSFETLVIQNITNTNELKAKLNEIINTGKDYFYDVSACLKSLITSGDREIVLLSIQAISELTKNEEKREDYASKAVITPIVNVLDKDLVADNVEIIKQSCRALGNLCADCDTSREILLESDGVSILSKLLQKSVENNLDDIKLLVIKILINFGIGGKKFSDPIFNSEIVDQVQKILSQELEKDDMNDDVISSCLSMLGVAIDNNSELVYKEAVNKTVLDIMKETTNIEISELCLEHLLAQAEHDSVKLLIASEGGLQLICNRIEQLMHRHETGDLNAEDSEVEAILKQACDLIIIVLTGDESMHVLYNNGTGEVYQTMVRWLNSSNYHLLTTAILAIGNFARQDDYCTQMMQDNIFDNLLDIFEIYHGHNVQIQKEPDSKHPIEAPTLIKIEHAVLSSLRNLLVPVANKKVAAAQGRAAPLLLEALTTVEDHHVAYKLLAAIRLLVDGQESVALQLAERAGALASVCAWGRGALAGAGGEAPRLLAWAAALLRRHDRAHALVKVDGCISSLVNMLVASHSLMQNEAILALTLLAVESLKTPSPEDQSDFNYEKSFISQLIKSEIGKHITILVDTNCAKMPVEVAENFTAFLDITTKNNLVAFDYKEAKVHECLKKFVDTRNDLNPNMKSCLSGIIIAISDIGKSE